VYSILSGFPGKEPNNSWVMYMISLGLVTRTMVCLGKKGLDLSRQGSQIQAQFPYIFLQKAKAILSSLLVPKIEGPNLGKNI